MALTAVAVLAFTGPPGKAGAGSAWVAGIAKYSADLGAYPPLTVLTARQDPAPGPSRSIVRYGALYSHGWSLVTGVKAYEVDLASKQFANPELWAAGATTGSDSRFSLIAAEPWYWSRTVTAYPLASAGFDNKKLNLGFGLAIQLQLLKFNTK